MIIITPYKKLTNFLNNASSEPTEVLSGVPQGSVLGPLVFFALYK